MLAAYVPFANRQTSAAFGSAAFQIAVIYCCLSAAVAKADTFPVMIFRNESAHNNKLSISFTDYILLHGLMIPPFHLKHI